MSGSELEDERVLVVEGGEQRAHLALAFAQLGVERAYLRLGLVALRGAAALEALVLDAQLVELASEQRVVLDKRDETLFVALLRRRRIGVGIAAAAAAAAESGGQFGVQRGNYLVLERQLFLEHMRQLVLDHSAGAHAHQVAIAWNRHSGGSGAYVRLERGDDGLLFAELDAVVGEQVVDALALVLYERAEVLVGRLHARQLGLHVLDARVTLSQLIGRSTRVAHVLLEREAQVDDRFVLLACALRLIFD